MDNVSENSLIELYYRCFAETRNELLLNIKSAMFFHKDMTENELVKSTLDWIQRTKYNHENCRLLYLIKNFEFTEVKIGKETHGGYIISKYLPKAQV